ncbi:cysteine desulfurase family protein [Leptolyngbya sp. BC1307]|uniref:aminotransferase class V-fold PLP-dependent enzyme n=1 Tax=Leptolyngbya sp. BC1307 TaxID=2029589 RepID=UPI000EFA70AE
MSRELIYLDYHSTTPVDTRVANAVFQAMITTFGNASSVEHEAGDCAESAVKQSAYYVSELIQAAPREVTFTSGTTESINIAIQGTVKHAQKSGVTPHIAISVIEHKAVLDTCYALKSQGQIKLTVLPVDNQAHVDLLELEQVCASGIHLLCVMAANNEVGTIYPIEKISAIAQNHNVPFLCDATQAVGKIPIRFRAWGITMLALSAHKFYGPKGIGALVVRKGYQLAPILYGGGQQKALRPGTLNVPGIVGLGEACRLRQIEMVEDERAIAAKRDRLQSKLLANIPGLIINGDTQNRLAGNLHISAPDIPNSAIIARVRHYLAISTGSACSSGVETPSHVLTAMRLKEEVIEGALRIGLGKFTTDEEIEAAAQILIAETRAIRKLLE